MSTDVKLWEGDEWVTQSSAEASTRTQIDGSRFMRGQQEAGVVGQPGLMGTTKQKRRQRSRRKDAADMRAPSREL